MSELVWLDENNPQFPDTKQALDEPNGLLAVGGALNQKTLIHAYAKGIFPWFSDDQPILWWSPSPRMMLLPQDVYFSRSLKKLARKKLFTITSNHAFEQVIDNCADITRPDQDSTWITEDIREAYLELHQSGHSHSVEAWQNNQLVGGLYGIALGGAFFGESMFSTVSGASKIAFATLVEQLKDWRFTLIDCQIHTHYLESFGASELPRELFEERLRSALEGFYPHSIFEEGQTEENKPRMKQKSKPSLWANWNQPQTGFSG